MMSAAILLTAVGEQGNVRTVSAEQGGPEGDSFASSLSARIDDTTTGQGKSLSVAGSLILPGSESVLPAKKPDGVMNLLADWRRDQARSLLWFLDLLPIAFRRVLE